MSAPTSLRLRPGLLTAWRSPGRLQLGVGAVAHVLEGLTTADELVVDALATGADPTSLQRLAALHGGPPERTRALLEALAGAGALERVEGRGPGARPDGLARTCAAVVGASPTGRAVALGLAAAGVGAVLVEDEAPVTRADVGPAAFSPSDLELSRGAAVVRTLLRHHPSVRVQPPPAGRVRPDVVVLVASGAHDARRAEPLVREGVPHLGVLHLGAAAVVGPLVRPGDSACLRCLDLHRTDRDPEWPRLLPQLAAPPGGPRRPEPADLAALAAAVAVQQVLAQLRGHEPAALDATLELDGAGALGVRPWSAHPACGCTWADGVLAAG
ncbi:thiamine biosynthesis protein ThiF [Streptomyces sp. NP160]|uniref:thiamine biosynthesis protein ThiF n=1 Tax=Streptomyces sp. NP160 TaxID=2586637 RepID=UPI00111A2E3B|nr:thiamine biosynthesis protein ThiF [Streptomyces sp. NP160]TNM60023.1 thiamine biosynthesis protein ThiF [Streptomyces sp. NP160]